MTSQNSCWEGKVCLVTGGVGFIGSHLCARLFDLGARVVSVDIEHCHKGTLFSIMNESKDIRVIDMDLSEPGSIDSVVEKHPDIVFHLAAVPYGPATTSYPIDAYRSNVVSTTNMLEAARRADVKHFILASSACYFGAATSSPLCEESDLAFPEHYYSYTKRQAEDQVKTYNEFYAVPATICRFVNIYGPGDRHLGRIVPQICTQLIAEKADSLQLYRSDGESIFEFLYVEDAVDALLTAGANPSKRLELLQFGPGARSRLRVLDLAEKLSLLYDKKIRKIVANHAASEREVRKYLDTTRTKRILEWDAKWELDDGLRCALDWYRENLQNIIPHEYPMMSKLRSKGLAT